MNTFRGLPYDESKRMSRREVPMRKVTLDDYRKFIGGQCRFVDHGPPRLENNVSQGQLADVDPARDNPLCFEWMARFYEEEGIWKPISIMLAFSVEHHIIEEREDGSLVLQIRSTLINEDMYLLPPGHPDCLNRIVNFTGNAPQNPHVRAA